MHCNASCPRGERARGRHSSIPPPVDDSEPRRGGHRHCPTEVMSGGDHMKTIWSVRLMERSVSTRTSVDHLVERVQAGIVRRSLVKRRW